MIAITPITGWMWLKDNSVGRISNENSPKSPNAVGSLVNWDETCWPNRKSYFVPGGECEMELSVESKIKQIGARMKIVGAQWKAENVPQYLKLRCAYLNGYIA